MRLLVATFFLTALVVVQAVTTGNTQKNEKPNIVYVPIIVSSSQPNSEYENYGYGSNGYVQDGSGYGGYGYGGYRPSAFQNYRPYYAAAYRPYYGYGSSYIYDPYYYGSYKRGIYWNGYNYGEMRQ